MGLVINNLTNPLTEDYKSLKSLIHGTEFKWYYMPSTWFGSADVDISGKRDISFYSHKIMERPDRYARRPFSEITSDIFPLVNVVLGEIFDHNNIECHVMYRINLNATSASSVKRTPYHTDLEIPHKNLIVYMSDFVGGNTYIMKDGEEISFPPKEDGILLFDGSLEHCISPPEGNNRRIVMVVNFY